MPKGTETTTKFKVDISDFKKAMQEANRAIRLANSEFKSASDGTKEWAKSTDGLTAKISQLNKVMDAEQRKLDILENEYNQVAEAQGKDSKEAQELQIKINNQTATVKKTQAQLNSYEQELKDAKNPLSQFGKKTDENTQKTKKASDGFTTAKGALADLVASGVKLAITGFKNLTREISNAYKEFDEGRDKAIKATGATGESAKKLTKSYSNVAKSVKGSFSDIGSVLGEVQTRFEFTDDVLEEATKDFIKFADVTETDGKTAVQLVSRAMANAEIEASKYKEVLDYLTTTAQKSGASVDKLAENLTKYGAPLRQLGFDTKESIALLGAWEKSGVNAQSAFAGLRKSVVNWSKDGKNSREEFTKTLDEIKKAPNITKATQKAIEVFGTKAGPDLADAIRAGKFEYQDFINALNNSKDSLKNTYKETQSGADKLSLAWQNAKTRMAEFASNIVEKYGPQIKQGIKSATDFIQQAFTWIITNGDKILAILKGIAVAFVTYKAVSIITSVVTSIMSLVTAVRTATTAMAGLNLIMSSNVIGAVIALVGGLVVGLTALSSSQEKAGQTASYLTQEQQKVVQASQEASKAYDEQKKASSELANENLASVLYLQNSLLPELDNLIGKNREVKKGYEDRANFILGQLNTALGTEYTSLIQVVDANGRIKQSIYDVINAKKAQILLEAHEKDYKKAVEESANAEQTRAIKAQEVAKAEEEYNKKKAEAEKAREALNEKAKNVTSEAAGRALANEAKQVQALENSANVAQQTLNKKQKEYRKTADTVKKYTDDINTYEKASTLVQKGETEKAVDYLGKLNGGFKTANSLADKSAKKRASILKQQVIDTETSYQILLDQYKTNSKNMTKEEKAQAKKQLNTSKKLADDAKTEYAKVGGNLVTGMKKGADDKSWTLSTSMKKIVDDAVKAAKKAGEIKSPSRVMRDEVGKQLVAGLSVGVDDNKKLAENSMTNLGKTSISAIEKELEINSPSKKTKKIGEFVVQGLVVGMASQEKSLVKLTKSLVKNVVKELSKLDNYNFSDVASNASNVFSSAVSEKIKYLEDKIAYQNEQKIKKYDAQIEAYNKKVTALEKKEQKTKDKKEKELIKAEIKKYKKLISKTTKAKEDYQKASSEALSAYNDAMNEYQSQAQKLIDDTINGITDKYQKRYDDLLNKQNNLIDKLKNAGDLFNISGANVITISDIKAQTQQIKDYADKLATIKKKVSADLFDKIASYDMEQGSAFIDQLLAMSDSELKAYSQAYDEKMAVSEQLAENLYKSDFEKIEKDYEKEINKAFKDLPKQLEKIGKNVMQGFIDGLTKNTDYMSKGIKGFVKSIVKQIKTELKIKSPSRVTMALGEFTGEGFGEGLAKTINYVKQKASLLANSVAQPLDDFHASIGTVQGVTSTPMTSTSVVNNYNLVQNNTSPKSLSALETYRARRQQVAMVKAMTGGG